MLAVGRLRHCHRFGSRPYGDAVKQIVGRVGRPSSSRLQSLPLENPGASPAANRAHLPFRRGRGGDSSSTTSTSGSDRTGRRPCRPVGRPVARVGRSCSRSMGRAILATLRLGIEQAQGQPGTKWPRDTNAKAAEQLKASHETNGPRPLPRLPSKTSGQR